MTEEIQKRVKEAANIFEIEAFRIAPYKEVELTDAFEAGAKFILEMNGLREALGFFSAWYPDQCSCDGDNYCVLCKSFAELKKAGLCE